MTGRRLRLQKGCGHTRRRKRGKTMIAHSGRWRGCAFRGVPMCGRRTVRSDDKRQADDDRQRKGIQDQVRQSRRTDCLKAGRRRVALPAGRLENIRCRTEEYPCLLQHKMEPHVRGDV